MNDTEANKPETRSSPEHGPSGLGSGVQFQVIPIFGRLLGNCSFLLFVAFIHHTKTTFEDFNLQLQLKPVDVIVAARPVLNAIHEPTSVSSGVERQLYR